MQGGLQLCSQEDAGGRNSASRGGMTDSGRSNSLKMRI